MPVRAMSSQVLVHCPRCRTSQARRAGNQAVYKCPKCGAMFDSDPSEGAPEVYNDPAKSLEAKERREAGQQRFKGHVFRKRR